MWQILNTLVMLVCIFVCTILVLMFASWIAGSVFGLLPERPRT
ncbi:hypothetical protein [Aquibaculum arenosum]|uniref:NADH dehydrogenase subunit 1 n=1 Tax=Aquibaculum arenosum TaxID=3032591 RepID=A0ABT5YJF7_9PROT|nr:hypothetical protein [Fodinicurvata sp. CAU 1616]MDF2094946.1 hypothetical protein [Fodinicurvata sp. CAU 1616]